MDRVTAEAYVHHTSVPVFRYSSQAPYFAVTYKIGHRVQHTLIRQNVDLSIDTIDNYGRIFQHYDGGILEVLHILQGVASPSPKEDDPVEDVIARLPVLPTTPAAAAMSVGR
jgi:hypothetical protein